MIKKISAVSVIFVLLFTLVANTVYGKKARDYESEFAKCNYMYNEGIGECPPSCHNLSPEDCDKYKECISKYESKYDTCIDKVWDIIRNDIRKECSSKYDESSIKYDECVSNFEDELDKEAEIEEESNMPIDIVPEF